jgi:hypothetical protein
MLASLSPIAIALPSTTCIPTHAQTNASILAAINENVPAIVRGDILAFVDSIDQARSWKDFANFAFETEKLKGGTVCCAGNFCRVLH